VIDKPSAKIPAAGTAGVCANTAQGAASNIVSKNKGDLNVRAECASEDPTTSEV
jgi:hypothetical protein